MTYPALSKTDVVKYVTGRRDNSLTHNDLHPEQRGSESDGDYETLIDHLDSIINEWKSTDLTKVKSQQDRDAVEGTLAVTLHEGFSSLPGGVLSDRDFWRYCAAYLFELVEWP